MIAMVFMCCGWSINWVKIILEPTGIPLHLGFLWDLGAGLQGNGNQCPELLLGSRNLVGGAMWWPQLVKLRTEMTLICLPVVVKVCRFPDGSTEELPKMDPLHIFLAKGKVV